MARVKLDKIVSAAAVSFVYCQRDVLHDCDNYRALCKCGVDSGWVSFDSQAVRDCTDAVRFVAGTLRAALTEKGCCCSAASAIYFPPADPLPSGPDLTGAKFHITLAGAHCGDATCTTCDPMERMVDGLTVRGCLERWSFNQRHDLNAPCPVAEWWRPAQALTPRQMDAARSAWSAALRAKVEEAEEKERRQIVCDDDRWEA